MDDADAAQASTEMIEAYVERHIRQQAAMIPAGEPGDCDECGCFNPRLVLGVCSPCRDLLEELKRKC